jgi:WD40 repeat protein
MYTTHGVSAAEQGNIQESLLWFGTAATLAEKGSHREWANRLRFRNWMRHLPVPIHAVRNPLGTVVDITIHPKNQYVLLHTDDGVVLWKLSSGKTLIHRDCHAAWSFNGEMLAIGSPDGHVKVFAFPESEKRFQFQVSGSGAPHVAFSSDDKLLAAGVQNVRVWNVNAQELLRGEAPHPSAVASLEFACGQTCLVTSSDDRMARVFDVEATGVASSPRFAPIPHRSVGSSLTHRFFRPLIVGDDHLIAGDNPLRLVELRSGETQQTFRFPGAPILNAAVNGSGDILSISGDYRGHVHCYDLKTGESLSEIEISRVRAPGIRFRPGQDALATIGLHSVLRFWDPRSGTRIGPELRNIGACNVVAFSVDGTLCAIAQSDQTVKLLRMPQATAKPDAIVDQKTKGLPFEPSMDQTGRWFVPQSARWLFKSDSVRELCVHETSTGRPCSATLDLSPEILSTAISPDGTLVATVTALPGTPAVQPGTWDNYWRRPGYVKIWNWQANEFIGEPIETKTLPMDCAFSPDGSELVVVCAYGVVLRINARQPNIMGEAAHPGQMIAGYCLPKRMVRYAQKGNRFFTAGFGKSVRLWTNQGGLLAELKHDHMVRDANFSSSGERLVTASEDGTVTIWDAQSGKPLGAPLEHPAKVHSVDFGPEGKLVATGCDNGMASVWNWRLGVRVCPDLEHTTGGVYSACFSMDGRLLITAAEGELRFWERFTGKQVSSPRYANMNAPSLVINSSAQVAVASSSHAGAIRAPNLSSVFNLREVAVLDGFGIHPAELSTLAEVVSGRRVELGGSTALTSDEWWQRWDSRRRTPE